MAGGTKVEAKAIYQRLLDNITECYLTEDFTSFQRYIHVPHHFRTANETFVLRNQDDLEALFHRYIAHCKDLDLTDYIRTCGDARFYGNDRIQGSHESHMLNGANLVCPVFKSTSVLMRIGKRWMVCASQNRLPAISAQGLAMREALHETALPIAADAENTSKGSKNK